MKKLCSLLIIPLLLMTCLFLVVAPISASAEFDSPGLMLSPVLEEVAPAEVFVQAFGSSDLLLSESIPIFMVVGLFSLIIVSKLVKYCTTYIKNVRAEYWLSPSSGFRGPLKFP